VREEETFRETKKGSSKERPKQAQEVGKRMAGLVEVTRIYGLPEKEGKTISEDPPDQTSNHPPPNGPHTRHRTPTKQTPRSAATHAPNRHPKRQPQKPKQKKQKNPRRRSGMAKYQ